MGIHVTNKNFIGSDEGALQRSFSSAGSLQLSHNANSYLNLSSCVQPIEKIGKRITIEGSIHHVGGGRGNDVAEVLDLTVKVLSRKGAPIGAYKINPRIDPPLGLKLGAYFCALDPISQGAGRSSAGRFSTTGKLADEMVADLAKIVSSFTGLSWQAESISDWSMNPRVGDDTDSSDERVWESLLNSGGLSADGGHIASPRKLRHRSVYMAPILPSFPELAKDPEFALDRQWRSSRENQGRLTTVTATLVPGTVNKIIFDVAVADTEGHLAFSDSYAVPVVSGHTGHMSHTKQAHLGLESVTADAMDDFVRYGLDVMRENLSWKHFEPPRQQRAATLQRRGMVREMPEPKNAHSSHPIDKEILRGQKHTGEVIFTRTLPSGAIVSIEQGVKAALLSISPNNSDASAWIGWTVTDAAGINRNSSMVRAELLHYGDLLCSGSPEQRIAALDGLRSLSSRKEGRPRGSSGSADKLLGFGFDADLKSFGGVVVSASAPSFDQDEQLLDLLNGIQLVQVTKSRRSHHTSELANFDRALFGIYPDQSLSVRVWNKLGGQLKARLSAATCQAEGGYQHVIRSISEILSASESQYKGQAVRTRSDIQQLLTHLVNQAADLNTLISPFDEKRGMSLPPYNLAVANQTYDRSAKLARLWAKITGGDPSSMRLSWLENSNLCLASFEKFGPHQLDQLDLITSAGGIKKVVGVFHLARDPRQSHTLIAEFAEPLRTGQDLRQIFRLVHQLSESSPLSLQEVKSSALARFLEERKA